MADQADEFILPDGQRELTRFDVARFRRHHQKTVRELRRQARRRRELEDECERLHAVVVEVLVRWYGADAGEGAGEAVAQLPHGLGGGAPFAFGGYLTPAPPVDDVDVGEDNHGDG
jgi:hypothetical protein